MKHSITKILLFAFLCFAFITKVQSQTIPLPFETVNNSDYADNEIYLAVMGSVDGDFVWLDLETGETKQTLESYNTLSASDGNSYADIFVNLSDLDNNEIDVPIMSSSRIYYSFEKPLYFKFYGANTYYSTPDVNNSSDINYDTRWEFIEFNIGDSGDIWANTSRVDFYQYAIGLEIYGENDYYGKVGETMSHTDIISKWESEADTAYIPCHDVDRGIIQAPSNLDEFKSGGENEDYFGTVIDAVWSKYSSETLEFIDANDQIWEGSVSNDIFTFTNQSTNLVAIINGKPTTHNVLSGAGLLWNDYSTTTANDIDLQKHFTAALNRGVLSANATSNVVQDWSVEADYYQSSTYNGYSKFFHSDGVSYNSQTYTFALDDVFDHSSLLTTSTPTKAVVTIGGFAESTTTTTTCAATAITPYLNVNSEGWQNIASTTVDEGDSVKFGPQPISSGSWSWYGPNSFSSTAREITLTDISTENAGTYVATYTNECGTTSTQSMVLSINSTTPIGSTIWLKSVSNSQYVSSDLILDSSNATLYANRYSYSDWESYTVVDAGNDLIRLYSFATEKYVRIAPSTGVVTSIGGTGTWTELSWINNSDGTISLKANINDQYLSNNSSTQILTNASSISGDTEKFTYGTISAAKSLITSLEDIDSITDINNELKIYPNPIIDEFTLEYNFSVNTIIEVYAMNSTKIFETNVKNSTTTTLNISDFTPGFYFLKVINGDNEVSVRKLIKK